MIKPTAKSIILTIYHFLIAGIIGVTIRPDRWLMGWDGLYPELNVPLNILRGLSAGWQEYYGSGLVGGHGFAATLPHTAIIGFLSLIIPIHLVRQAFIYLCYYLGGLGMLFVSRTFLSVVFSGATNSQSKDSGNEPDGQPAGIWYASLAASLFYLLNPATIQSFYVPLEAFTVHFAALPWLTYGTLLLLERVSRKRILFFLTVSVFASIQGFIPAVFLAYAASLLIVTGTFIITHRFRKPSWKPVLTIWACVFAANSYWLGSVGYFTITRSQEYTTAYNNIISTPEFIAKSIKFGNLSDVALLKGLMWESNELGGAVLEPWITHFNNPAIPSIGYTVFALALFGALWSLVAKHRGIALGMALSFLYFFGNIAIDMPPFSSAIQLLQSISPDMAQAFRTTFTKFGIGLGFHYALFLSVGVHVLAGYIRRLTDEHAGILLPAAVSMLIVLYGLPVFQGALVYPKLFTGLPRIYPELISYMNGLPDGKIADFPQDCAEGWYNQVWGYFGSGFLWYGIRQPIMARAFDVWSLNNENYYWEMSRALRSQDYEAMERVFDKYDIRYILYDQNLTHCRSQKGFLSSLEFGNHLLSSATVSKLKTFSANSYLPITVYERQNASASSVTIHTSLPNVSGVPKYTDQDAVYASYGAYMSDPGQAATLTAPAPLFSKRGGLMPAGTFTDPGTEAIATISANAMEPAACGQERDGDPGSLTYTTETEGAIRMISTDADICRTATFDGIDTSLPYALEVSARHITGEPLFLSVTNKGRSVGLDIPIGARTTQGEQIYYLPPTFASEVSYAVTVKNRSFSRYSTINDLFMIRLLSVGERPEDSLSDMNDDSQTSDTIYPDMVFHPVSSLYIVHAPSSESGEFLTLNQSYDPGWVAYDISGLNLVPQLLPFLFGTRLTDHVPVNNWQNGWKIRDHRATVYAIFFAPQIFEYIGFGLVLLAGFTVIKHRFRLKRPHTPHAQG